LKSLCANFTLVTPRPAIFLDRDGVIIEDLSYVNSIDRTRIILSAVESIKFARSKGFLIFIVTNQAGVARNFYTEVECVEFNKWLMNEFSKRGAPIDQLVYCPSHPEFGNKNPCECRKPGSGMLSYIAKLWHVDIGNSLMIGDKESDLLAGQNFGIQSKQVNSESNLMDILRDHVDSLKQESSVEVLNANR
jgi:D-glycero-D-manno-heptose 1,7-bisphosphate phosphatase